MYKMLSDKEIDELTKEQAIERIIKNNEEISKTMKNNDFWKHRRSFGFLIALVGTGLGVGLIIAFGETSSYLLVLPFIGLLLIMIGGQKYKKSKEMSIEVKK